MSETNFLFDTSALIEFFDSTAKGIEVQKILEENTRFSVPSVVIAELISKLKIKGFDPNVFVDNIHKSADVLVLDSKIAKRAGELHAKLKKQIERISLSDCIIMAHAEAEDAFVVTCDTHFKDYKKVRLL